MRENMRIHLGFVTLALYLVFNNLVIAQVPFSFDVENRGADCNVNAGQLSTNNNLPNPFQFNDGRSATTFEDWTCRRNEIKADIEQYEIGPKPDRPENITASYSGGTLTVTVTENGRTLTITSRVNMPNGSGPFPVVIGMNAATGQLSSDLFNGVIQIPFNHDQVATYTQGSRSTNEPFFQLYPELTSNGYYSAWSWGISRIIDGLEIVQSQMNADLEHIAVTGCSYAGKMALFAGAFDERIALTIAQESGGGGINSWRTSQNFTNRTGTNIEKINNTNFAWFKQSMGSLDPYRLPHDHHELIAMIAPRAFLTLGNPGFEWLGDESGYKSAMAALEVWKAMGVEDRFGYDFTGGHQHCQAASRQNTSVTAFVDKFLRGNSNTNTSVSINPSQSGFDLNYSSNIDWNTPEISFNPNVPSIAITSPTMSSVGLGIPFDITATVDDQNNDVTLVEFYANDIKIGESTSAPYSVSWTGDEAGTVTLSAVVTDAENNTSSDDITINVRAPQTPYGGTAHSIPGIIQFEEYDNGGQDWAYYDSSPGSETDVNFRLDEDVDIEECQDTDGGYNIGWATAGEWTEYTVNVENTGTYNIDIRVACNGDGRTISLDTDGKNIASNVEIPNTGGWQEWETITIENASLNAGEQIIRMTIGSEDYVNLNYMEFIPLSITGATSTISSSYTVYPNPFSNSLNITVQGTAQYSIYNVTGELVEKGTIQSSGQVGTSLLSGLYILQLENSTVKEIMKITKK